MAIAAGGCGSATQPFGPAHPSGSKGAVYSVASYDMKIGPSELGNATVWSEGATGDHNSNQRVLDVQMAIHNTTPNPIVLDVAKSDVSVTTRDGHSASLGTPVHLGGSGTVAPESSGRVGLRYALPANTAASDVAEFDFNWRIASSAGYYRQSTRFLPVSPPDTEDVSDRFPSCNGVHVASLEECVDVAPPLSRPVQ